MRTLVIDTATRACSVALFDDESVVASYHEVIGRGHAERLLPLIADLPECGRAAQIVVNVGPGSFTGIRVGVAAARALGLAWGVPVSGYGCLTLVAAMARAVRPQSASVDAIMAGGHGEYFFQSFSRDGLATCDVASLSLSMVEAKPHAQVVAGDVPALFSDRDTLDILPDAACWHLVAGLTPLAASPAYGRAPDAKLPKGMAA